MSKGILGHILITIVYVLAVLFIIQDEDVDTLGRVMIVFLLVVINVFSGLGFHSYNEKDNWYNHKL